VGLRSGPILAVGFILTLFVPRSGLFLGTPTPASRPGPRGVDHSRAADIPFLGTVIGRQSPVVT
jgi:hypothetical protein